MATGKVPPPLIKRMKENYIYRESATENPSSYNYQKINNNEGYAYDILPRDEYGSYSSKSRILGV